MRQELSLDDVRFIVKEFEKIQQEDEENAFEWSMDEDQCGIAYDSMSFDDICRIVANRFNNTKKEQQ